MKASILKRLERLEQIEFGDDPELAGKLRAQIATEHAQWAEPARRIHAAILAEVSFEDLRAILRAVEKK